MPFLKTNRRTKAIVSALVFLTVAGLFSLISNKKIFFSSSIRYKPTFPSSDKLSEKPPKGEFLISNVIDGDTIVLDNGYKVRLIGIDAPEIQHENSPAEEFGYESKSFLKQIAEGKKCILKYEANETYDKYGRLLAYIFVENKLLNSEIIKQGYARVYTRFTFSKEAEFINFEREARKKGTGIWSKENAEKKKPPISWADADKHIGEYCFVGGVIVSTGNSGKICFLNFHKDYRNHLTAVIFSSDFSRFPENPEKYYLGKKVLVSGYIKEYKGKPEIVLTKANQIKILEK